MEPLLSNAERHAASSKAFTENPSYEESTRIVSPTRSDLAVAWWLFWLLTWAGTTLGGGLFGLLLGGFLALIGLASNATPEALIAPFMGFGIGFVWAGGVGLLTVPTLGILAWTFWLQKKPLLLAAIAGGFTGLLCMPILFMFTMPIGALTAFWVIRKFLNSQYGECLLAAAQVQTSVPEGETIVDSSFAFDDLPEDASKMNNTPAVGLLHFSIFDLLLRMSGFAVLITLWLTAIKLFYSMTSF